MKKLIRNKTMYILCAILVCITGCANVLGLDAATENKVVTLAVEKHITSVADFLAIADSSVDTYILDADIDFANVEYTKSIITNFKGILNGNGHCIKNLNINSPTTPAALIDINYGKITNLGIVNANIKGKDIVAAVAGTNNLNASIENVYTTGNICGETNVGGIVASNASGTIRNAYSHANVEGNANVGGIVGASNSSCVVDKVYSIGIVSGETNVGGIAGDVLTTTCISNAYSVERPFKEALSLPSSVQKKDLAAFADAATYVGFTLDTTWTVAPNKYATLVGVPHICIEDSVNFAGGDGTRLNPYKIGSVENYKNVDKHLCAAYKLNVDLNFKAFPNVQIGNSAKPFKGILDGNNKKILEMSFTNPATDCIGLVAVNAGIVQDIGIVAADIVGRNNVGAAVGHNKKGSIERVYVEGINISGEDNVGGIAGYIESGGVQDTYVINGKIQGNNFAGGAVGYNKGKIQSIYTKDMLVSTKLDPLSVTSIGNVIGKNEADATKVIGDLYYLATDYPKVGIGTDTKRLPNAKGKTAEELKLLSTFAGWDSGIWTSSGNKVYLAANPCASVESITLDKTNVVDVGPGDTFKISVTVNPVNAAYKEYTLESTNPNVATIDSAGNVTCIDVGETKILAKAKHSSVTAEATVTVSSPQYIITIPAEVQFGNPVNIASVTDRVVNVPAKEVEIKAEVKYLNGGSVKVSANTNAQNKYEMTEATHSANKLNFGMYKADKTTVLTNDVASFGTNGKTTIYLKPDNWGAVIPGVYDGNITFTINYQGK